MNKIHGKRCPNENCPDYKMINYFDTFCHTCGKELQPAPTCQICGEDFRKCDRYCPKCGTPNDVDYRTEECHV